MNASTFADSTSAADPAAQVQPSLAGATVHAAAIVYRLYDVGYEVDLDRVLGLLTSSAAERIRPIQGEARAIHIPNPPITVTLGTERLVVADRHADAEVSARVFDFGVVSLRLRVAAPPDTSWPDFVTFGNRLDVAADVVPLCDRTLGHLLDRIRPAVTRPAISSVTEDYAVFRITSLTDERGAALSGDALRDEDVIPLLLNEQRPLSASARRELLPHRFSYYTTDLAILSWDNALVLDQATEEADVQYVLEFANAQLLELRVYDALLNAELPRMYERVASARSRRVWGWTRRYAKVLSDLQTVVADSTEVVERVENALKLTGDVYLARIYAAALEIFRGRDWRKGIDRKLENIRETYEMLNAESEALRAEVLEVAILLFIIAEMVISLVRH